MPKILCVGCKWEFKDPRRYSNHKRQCTCHINTDIARHFEQLKNRESNLNQIQVDGSGETIYEGQQGLVNTAGGIDDDINMGVPVHLIVDLLLSLSHHLNMIRMKSLAPQPLSCTHLADPIEKSAFQCAIGMNFHHTLPLSPIKTISMIPPTNLRLVPTVFLSQEALKAHWGLQHLSVCHWHTVLVPTPMGSTTYIQWVNHCIPLMSTIP